MNKELVLSIFRRYMVIFMHDNLHAFNEKRLTDLLAHDSNASAENEDIDEILLYGASHTGAERITGFLLSLGVKVFIAFTSHRFFFVFCFLFFVPLQLSLSLSLLLTNRQHFSLMSSMLFMLPHATGTSA